MNYFYCENPLLTPVLSAEESQHCIKVLRKKKGDSIEVIDGKGSQYVCEILEDNFRKCSFQVISSRKTAEKGHSIHIAIAPTKNLDRIEWFVEKCCELGTDEISLIRTARTERKAVKLDRLEKKAISALKQSKNLYKCRINALISFENYIRQQSDESEKFIAVVDDKNPSHLFEVYGGMRSVQVLIGPEGDFTPEEVELACSTGFRKTSLGSSVLRTETAGVVASHILTLKKDWK